jgi:hypothetical protein
VVEKEAGGSDRRTGARIFLSLRHTRACLIVACGRPIDAERDYIGPALNRYSRGKCEHLWWTPCCGPWLGNKKTDFRTGPFTCPCTSTMGKQPTPFPLLYICHRPNDFWICTSESKSSVSEHIAADHKQLGLRTKHLVRPRRSTS